MMVQPAMKDLFIFTGEKSGDLHGSHLLKAVKERLPCTNFRGVGGPMMRNTGVTGPLKMEDFEVMGFSDVLLSLPKLFRQFYHLRDHILLTKPDAVVLIDYPGFNLRLAKALRKADYSGKIIQYVSPSVWAWGKHRINDMARTLDMLLVIYPFEPKYFVDTSLKTIYVGNPICEYLNKHQYAHDWRESLGIPHSGHLIALFPGSRIAEVKSNLSLMLKAAENIIDESPDTVFGISCAHPTTLDFLNSLKKHFSKKLRQALYPVSQKFTYELMRDSRTAIAKSGTVTLELAFHHRPTIVIYQLSTLNRWYAKHVLKLHLPHYCIVNILAQQEVFPELIENGLSSENLFKLFQALNHDSKLRQTCIDSCARLAQILGDGHASINAANALIGALQC